MSAGVDVRTAAGRLGHRNVSTTLNVYAHFLEQSDRQPPMSSATSSAGRHEAEDRPLEAVAPEPLRRSALSGYLDSMSLLVVDQLPDDPLDALRELSRREVELGQLRRATIEAARAAGATWEQVGSALGVSRQAAWEYYSRSARAKLEETAVDPSDLSDDEAMDLAVQEVKAALVE